MRRRYQSRMETGLERSPRSNLLSVALASQGFIPDKDLAQAIVAGLNRSVNAPQGSAGLPLKTVPPLLREDEGGVVRVGESRVSLDLIVEQYEKGMTAEDMVRAYDSLGLADVHDVIGYYLRHREEVQAYLKRRSEEAAILKLKIETERPRIAREELLARCRARGTDHAPAGQ